MNVLKPRIWTAGDIVCLKWSAALAGAVAGAYLSAFVRQYVWLFVAAVILFAIKPAAGYFKKRGLGG